MVKSMLKKDVAKLAYQAMLKGIDEESIYLEYCGELGLFAIPRHLLENVENFKPACMISKVTKNYLKADGLTFNLLHFEFSIDLYCVESRAAARDMICGMLHVVAEYHLEFEELAIYEAFFSECYI